ncbi:hypothetical protein AWB82_01070 [Caballeronia glebae]|uniref:Uncharacterized protein n=1 Tax=Caballeronia glebae TaxID=1777143 RepID=A0A157ZQ58_9BURK|nr:hypothetical protein AWB82_01070 [Caballeronia glebae]
MAASAYRTMTVRMHVESPVGGARGTQKTGWAQRALRMELALPKATGRRDSRRDHRGRFL